MRSRELAHKWLAVALIFAAACSGGDDGALACVAAGEARFILTSQEGISEMRLDGSRRTLLDFPDETYPLDPAVSPDCKRVAFSLQPPAKPLPDGNLDFGSDLVVAGLDGKGQRTLAKHERIAEFLRTPAWLSSNELLYTYRGRNAAGEPDFRIERLDLDSGESRRYIEDAIDPAVSKDGGSIVYVFVDPVTQAETLTLATADLSRTSPLVGNDSNLALFSAQVFSPDGSRIAFAAVDLTQPLEGGSLPARVASLSASHPFAQDVWVVNRDGSGLRRVAEVAENMPSIAWSADGAFLYVLGPGAFWRLDAASGQATKLAPGIPLGQIALLAGS
jgi:Tol biopolymer transport system component